MAVDFLGWLREFCASESMALALRSTPYLLKFAVAAELAVAQTGPRFFTKS